VTGGRAKPDGHPSDVASAEPGPSPADGIESSDSDSARSADGADRGGTPGDAGRGAEASGVGRDAGAGVGSGSEAGAIGDSGDAGEGSAERGVGARDRVAVAAQLGRVPRAMRAVAHRCPCGLPDVVETSPRLAEGTPFPTLYYLTCPRASSMVGRLEASGVMREMADRLRSDPQLAAAYRAAHEAYLARRVELADVPEIDGVSAGGMPTRVKCLHALLAHSLAAGPGVNPLGDEVRAAVGEWWAGGPCVSVEEPE
jgi:hypothetical protein